MSDAPEWIWAFKWTGKDDSGEWYSAKVYGAEAEYLRADIAASQLAEARAEAERWAAQALKEEECRIAWQAERDRLAADNARLREALERILNAAGCGVDLYNDEPGREAIKIARAALAGKE